MPTGELFTRWTVRLALLLYVASVCAQLRYGRSPQRRTTRIARALWTIGCAAFIAHVLLAFHFFHNWSHADAWRETARQTAELTGVHSGFGLYLNYAFTLIWLTDTAWWWLGGLAAYARRAWAIDAALHGFFAFMAFNATVVFESGNIRRAGVIATIILLALLLDRIIGGSADARRRGM